MDGNGRWAKERGLSRQAGHRAGTENIRRIIQAFGERGVEVLTLYAFSTENWTRPRREVNALMRLIPRVINASSRSCTRTACASSTSATWTRSTRRSARRSSRRSS